MSEYKTVYGKALRDMTLEEVYLDWLNEFGTYAEFGKYYGITTEHATELICSIRNIVNNLEEEI